MTRDFSEFQRCLQEAAEERASRERQARVEAARIQSTPAYIEAREKERQERLAREEERRAEFASYSRATRYLAKMLVEKNVSTDIAIRRSADIFNWKKVIAKGWLLSDTQSRDREGIGSGSAVILSNKGVTYGVGSSTISPMGSLIHEYNTPHYRYVWGVHAGEFTERSTIDDDLKLSVAQLAFKHNIDMSDF